MTTDLIHLGQGLIDDEPEIVPCVIVLLRVVRRQSWSEFQVHARVVMRDGTHGDAVERDA